MCIFHVHLDQGYRGDVRESFHSSCDKMLPVDPVSRKLLPQPLWRSLSANSYMIIYEPKYYI